MFTFRMIGVNASSLDGLDGTYNATTTTTTTTITTTTTTTTTRFMGVFVNVMKIECGLEGGWYLRSNNNNNHNHNHNNSNNKVHGWGVS